jgi:hypothetical protein
MKKADSGHGKSPSQLITDENRRAVTLNAKGKK